MDKSQYNASINEGLKEFASKYEVDMDIINSLRELLLLHYRATSSVSVAHSVAGSVKAGSGARAGTGSRRKTGYNVYIKAKFDESKASGTDTRSSQQKMAEFSKEWKDLSKEDKLPFEQQAASYNAEGNAAVVDDSVSSVGPAKKRGLSGYNLFYRESKDQIRADMEASGSNENLMKHVGAAWKALPVDEQKDWAARAKALHT